MPLDRYILLTGSINNAGDFLIRQRAMELLSLLRPDRTWLEMPRWKPLDDDALEKINASRALILAGGPALQYQMYPGLFPLRKNLNEIKVPIVLMGIGWKSLDGDWLASQHYPLSRDSLRLMDHLAPAPVLSGVRDYFTLHVLNRYGVNNVIMTGCPALYVPRFFDTGIDIPRKIERISFSVGVSFLHSPGMHRQAEQIVLALKDRFPKALIEAVFHHTLEDDYLEKYPDPAVLKKNRAFAAWFKKQGVPVMDVSGGADKMIAQYTGTDLHVGYRVHAHILATSMSRPSILVAEDGRGKGLYQVLSGLIFDGFRAVKTGLLARGMAKTGLADTWQALPFLHKDIINALDYEMSHNGPRLKPVRHRINDTFHMMKQFMAALP
jgi:hypothetical protein